MSSTEVAKRMARLQSRHDVEGLRKLYRDQRENFTEQEWERIKFRALSAFCA